MLEGSPGVWGGRCHSLYRSGWVRIRSEAAEKEGRRLIQKAIQKKPANQVSERGEGVKPHLGRESFSRGRVGAGET